jgi:hypothetical protein
MEIDDIIEKLEGLENNKKDFKVFLKEILLSHEPFEDLILIRDLYPTDFFDLTKEIVKDSIESTKEIIQILKK